MQSLSVNMDGKQEISARAPVHHPRVVSCRRDLEIAPTACADPVVCGPFCTNARVAVWKSFHNDRASQPLVQRRRLERSQMIQHVLQVLRSHYRVCLLSVNSAPLANDVARVTLQETSSVNLLVYLSKHIELLMYRAAFSKAEYDNLATVYRRVQHFAMVMNCNPRWKIKVIAKHHGSSQQDRVGPRTPVNRTAQTRRVLEERQRKVWLFTPSWWARARHTRHGHELKPDDSSSHSIVQGVLINGNEKCYRSLVALTKSLEDCPRRRRGGHSLKRQSASSRSSTSCSPFRVLFEGHDESVLLRIFSFIDGLSVIQGRAINSLCYRILPRAITDLRISTTGLIGFLDQLELQDEQQTASCHQTLFPYLQHLCLHADTRAATMTATVSSMSKRHRSENVSLSTQPRAVPHTVVGAACPPQSAPARASGELAVLAVARLIRSRHCMQLRKLCLCATFVNSVQCNAVFKLTEALATPGACPLLECLWLGGNALGDYGAMCVARVLSSRACPQLSFLDLRSNSIGHDGMRSLASALSALGDDSQLRQLCLGSNLLTSAAAHELSICAARGSLRRLVFLGLDGNFLSPASLQDLATVLISGACPRLKELCLGGNTELTEETIAGVFRDAADATDGASWGLFRPYVRSMALTSPKRRRMA